MIRGLHKSQDANAQHPALTKGENRAIAGVCSGIADYLEADTVVVRTTAIVLCICTLGLAIIPYAALAVALPSARGKDVPVDIDPLDIRSDKYQQVVGTSAPKGTPSGVYAARADAGHVPPTPPGEAGSDVFARLRYCSQRHDPLTASKEDRPISRLAIVLALVVSLCILFAVAASYAVAQIPGSTVLGFWPMLFIVAGTAALACFADKISLAVRAASLVFCIELCVAVLPFTLGICPIESLARLGDASVLLWFIAGLLFVAAIVFERVDLFVLTVGLTAVALVVSFYEVGVFARLVAMPAVYRHNMMSGLFIQGW